MSSDDYWSSLHERICRFLSDWPDSMTPMIGATLLLLLNAGCGGVDAPERVSVSGKVTIDGDPLTFGLIRFIPAEGDVGPGAATQILVGEFRFSDEDGPVVGHHRVEIEATDHQQFEIDDERAFAAQFDKTGQSPLATNPIPGVYNVQSVLTANVQDSEDQAFQFDLKSNP